MKKIAFLISTVVIIKILLPGCSTIDIAVLKNENLKSRIKKIVVFPFQIDGATWGDELSDALCHHFFKKGQIEVVERNALKKILKEQSLSMSGMIDQSRAIRIGKMVGADLIILGRGSALKIKNSKGKPVRNLIDTFSLKAINVETGTMLITVRKEPGRDWDAEYRAKWLLTFGLIWDRDDILIESSNYDEIAEKIVDRILDAIEDMKE